MFATCPEAWKLPPGTPLKLLWGGFMGDWPNVPPGTHAAVELHGHVLMVPVMYLLGPLGEPLLDWM